MNRRAPVRNRLPTAADWKLNVEEGRVRLMISWWRVERNDRISSRLEGLMEVQRGEVASMMESHSRRAVVGEELERRVSFDASICYNNT